ncbi:MAG: hypothetical protein E2577_18830, partial [Starkeya sp.]|nr:hypothetical protein [Starkeya sp.]
MGLPRWGLRARRADMRRQGGGRHSRGNAISQATRRRGLFEYGFTPVGIFIWLGVKIDRVTAGAWRTLPAMIGFVALTASVFVGFRGDWIKSFYVREWKAGIASHALDILAAREDQLPPEGPATLLWDPVQVKRGLQLFYRNDLWVFRSRDIKVKGLRE